MKPVYIVAANTNWDGTLDPCCIFNSLKDAKAYAKESFFLEEEVVIFKSTAALTKTATINTWKHST